VTYEQRLGFSKPQRGRLPNGIRNVNFYFADATYLELLTHYDRAKATWLADFTDKHSGALFVVLSVFSVEGTEAYLMRRGHRISRPVSGTIQTAADPTMPGEKWKTFAYARSPLPGDPLYFIAYARPSRDAYLRKLKDPRVRHLLLHENTALGLRSVWLAVPDIGAAARAFSDAGFEVKERFVDRRLRARGQVVLAGEGFITLLQATDGKSPVQAFLNERKGPGLMGVTFKAGSADAAARLISSRTGEPLRVEKGPFGPSLLVPPHLAHGSWLEFLEQ